MSNRRAKVVGLNGQPLSTSNLAYEASSSGRRLSQWDAPHLGPNDAATSELLLLQRRSRAITRNNPWLSRGLKAHVANEIGTGIVPRSASKNKTFRNDMRQEWLDWLPFADFNGVLSAYAIQAMSVRSRREAGEVFIRIHRKAFGDKSLMPVQFQILESDFCPVDLDRSVDNGNEIISGIELDADGHRVAYWMYPKHPGDKLSRPSMSALVRIPANQIVHHYIPSRPGALRGEPESVQAMVRTFMLDKYEDAELARKQSRAHFTGVIQRPDYGKEDYKFDPISGAPINVDDDDVPMIDLEPGTFPNLLPGEEINLFNGDETGRAYADFMSSSLLATAAGQDIPYQLQTGDYSGINDRVWRAIMNQYHREIEQIQDLYTINQVCRIMWEECVDAAVFAGMVNAPRFDKNRRDFIRATHTPQAWKHIHPTQDVDAMVKLKDAGFDSRQGLVTANRSADIETIDNQRKEDMEREETLGLNQQVNEEKVKGNDKDSSKVIKEKPKK